MKIHPIQTHNSLDNIFYILEYGNKQAVAIDPSDTNMCQNFLDEHNLKLEKIFITHEHYDHYEGVQWLLCSQVYASQIAASDMPISVSRIISDEEIIFEYEDTKIQAIATPGHAWGHMMFVVYENESVTAILVGDVLFAWGVGHTRSGSSEVLYESIQKFKQYDDEVVIYSWHDYLQTNLGFIEKYFPERKEFLDNISEKKGDSLYFTILWEERKINPFLSANKDEFIKIRELRNTW